MKNSIKILISLVIAALSVITIGYIQNKDKIATITYLVPKKEIAKGEEVTRDKLKEVIKKDSFNYGIKVDEFKEGVAKEILYKNEIINKNRITNSLKSLVAKENTVEYSLKLNPEDMVAGTIRSGDLVNIHAVLEEEEVELKNIKVLSVYNEAALEIKESNEPVSMIVLNLTKDQVKTADLAKNSKTISVTKN